MIAYARVTRIAGCSPHSWALSLVIAIPLFVLSAHAQSSPAVTNPGDGVTHAILFGLPAGTLIWLLVGLLAFTGGAVFSMRGQREVPAGEGPTSALLPELDLAIMRTDLIEQAH